MWAAVRHVTSDMTHAEYARVIMSQFSALGCKQYLWEFALYNTK